MELYSVDEAFEILKSFKITTNKESVRRWLRQGIIKGITPSSRKEGWQISKKSLDEFVQERLPDSYATNVVKEPIQPKNAIITPEMVEEIRASMWLELANKNIWEGFIELKKRRIHECIEHRGYSKELEERVWKAIIANSREYSKPRIFYLLDAFGFERKRLLLDKNFKSIEEQVIFAIIEYVRQSNLN